MSVKDQRIVIVDTGCANLSSVQFAVSKLGYDAKITDDIATIERADKVILPGVGSAKHAMDNIRTKGLISTLQRLTQPTLGFCLGMQLMASSSVEGASNEPIECLGMIPTEIKPLASEGLRLPHMGWNTLTSVSKHPVLAGITAEDYFYFVHSFAAPISEFTVASCFYGSAFSAAIAKDNFIGCQFHPERSSKLGSKIIQNFIEI
ncbi:imidazole glycerol phosphate synthase subunit HisH [Thalassotalea sediminis]|uniref:imidazole glycerol phosphate synthase subunit HisH n=1 Tax=Thalassotalea sediminis TaxID=1759089 RepID=UPI0025742A4E|nr:imidazole glycerol phosphate synthase subunit HisH [Thalassotalea sediminis]